MKTVTQLCITLAMLAVLALSPGCEELKQYVHTDNKGNIRFHMTATDVVALVAKLATSTQKSVAQERAAAYKKQRESAPQQSATTAGASQPVPPPKVIAVEVPPADATDPAATSAPGQPISMMLVDYDSGVPIDNNVYEVAARPTNDQRIELKKPNGQKADAVFVSSAGLP